MESYKPAHSYARVFYHLITSRSLTVMVTLVGSGGKIPTRVQRVISPARFTRSAGPPIPVSTILKTIARRSETALIYGIVSVLDWTRRLASQPEIQQYLENVAHDYHLDACTTFNSEVLEAVWDEKQLLWTVQTKNLETGLVKLWTCNIVCLTIPWIWRGVEPYVYAQI